MADQVPGTPVPQPAPVVAPAPAAPQTMAQQILDSQKPATPVAPAAPVVDKPVGDAPPVSAPPEGDSALKAQLAEAEKRLQDTQRWGHKNAQEAAQLKQSLTQIQNHPVIGRLLQVMAEGPAAATGNAQTDAEQQELRQAFAEYQASKTDEEAFSKIMKFAETRGARKAMSEVQKNMAERENEARVQQRNQLTVQAINKTVSDSASDVPLELFWAMSGRAEAECPATITDYTERLQWQVGRAVDLSREVLKPRLAQATSAAVVQNAVNAQAGAIMAPGGAAPGVQAPAVPAKPVTMADFIKNMQRAQLASSAKRT